MSKSQFSDEYFEKILKNHLKSEIKVKSVEISPCNSASEGFLSLLLRAVIEYEKNSKISSISLILKSESSDEFALSIIGENGFNVQDTEVKFFNKIGGKMLKIFGDSKVIPQVIFVDETHKILVLEDLRPLNFTMANRLVGLDENHVLLLIDKIAKFHAASLKILEENPIIFNEFDVGVISRKVDKVNLGNEGLFKAATEEIETWSGFEEIARKMGKLTVTEGNNKCFDFNENEFNVLIHGDIWTTNAMFRYGGEGEELVDAVLIDFQFSLYASATLDLIHLFFSSLNDEIFAPEKIEEFVRIYYKRLKENLLNYDVKSGKIPSLHDFLIEFHKKLFYGFFLLTSIFPLMTSDDPENSFATHHSDSDQARAFRRRVMKENRYQLAVRKFLPYFDKWGVLDV